MAVPHRRPSPPIRSSIRAPRGSERAAGSAGISKRFRRTWVVNCNARRAVFSSTSGRALLRPQGHGPRPRSTCLRHRAGARREHQHRAQARPSAAEPAGSSEGVLDQDGTATARARDHGPVSRGRTASVGAEVHREVLHLRLAQSAPGTVAEDPVVRERHRREAYEAPRRHGSKTPFPRGRTTSATRPPGRRSGTGRCQKLDESR